MPVVVELGHKLRPLATYPGFLPDGHRYVGIEHGPALRKQFETDAKIHRNEMGVKAPLKRIVAGLQGQLEAAKQRAEGIYPGRVQFKEITHSVLPFGPEQVHEVWAANVFSDPTVEPSDITALLEETRRVLERGGTLVVVEDTTGRPIEEIEAQLQTAGLEAVPEGETREAFVARITPYLRENAIKAEQLRRSGKAFRKFGKVYVLRKAAGS